MIQKGLLLIAAAMLAASLAFLENWLALIPWRRTKGKHWTEQARLLYPARVAATSNVWVIPTILTLAALIWLRDISPPWPLLAIAGLLGAVTGTLPMDREVFPRIAMPDLLRQAIVSLILRFLVAFVFLGAVTVMPVEFSVETWIITATFIGLFVIWLCGGIVWVGKLLGLFTSAPARLKQITSETAAKMNVPVKEVLLVRVDMAQAFAMIYCRRVLFTERLLTLCSDGELASICAHELAHLNESRLTRATRLVGSLRYLPWVLFKPLIQAYRESAFAGLMAITLFAPLISQSISRRLETRADDIAKQNAEDPKVYAAALTKIYEDRLTPAVIAKKRRRTHPDLYDRLLAVGVTPDFPRPTPAKTMSWNGWISAFVLGLLFSNFVIDLYKLWSVGSL